MYGRQKRKKIASRSRTSGEEGRFELEFESRKHKQQSLETQKMSSDEESTPRSDDDAIPEPSSAPERGGMADAFARILGQKLPEGLSPDAGPVLAKRKTKQMKGYEEEIAQRKKLKQERATKKVLKEVGLHTPDFRDIEHERMLRRVATRGVVALFNAIAKHQHALNSEGSDGLLSSERDVRQLAKDNFIQMLKNRGGSGSKGSDDAHSGPAASVAETSIAAVPSSSKRSKGNKMAAVDEAESASSWLQDDFMVGKGSGKSIRDWERHDERGGSDDDEDDDKEVATSGGGYDDEDESEDDPFEDDGDESSALAEGAKMRMTRKQRVKQNTKQKKKAAKKTKGRK